MGSGDPAQIPLLWINLDRAAQRRRRMHWAIQQGGWQAQRLQAIDAQERRQRFWPLAHPLTPGCRLPGLWRQDEADPHRPTSRAELACLASWKRLLLLAEQTPCPMGWILLMEDDLGASLAAPQGWRHSLLDLINSSPSGTWVIQLAAINAAVRQELFATWRDSGGQRLSVAKEQIRSHGNGAVLLHQRALPRLIDGLNRLTAHWAPHCHPLVHPWRIRPVADKWLYGALPPGRCRVATYPHFCLEAQDSSLHAAHVQAFHQPSRSSTLELWRLDHRTTLLQAQQRWDHIA
jgi:hypothetical protein